MIERWSVMRSRLYLLFDCIVVSIAFGMAYVLRSRMDDLFGIALDPVIPQVKLLIFLILPIWAMSFALVKVHREDRPGMRFVVKVVEAFVIAAVGLLSLLYLIKLFFVSRIFLALFLALALVMVIVCRVILYNLLHFFQKQQDVVRTLVVGTSERARMIAKLFHNNEAYRTTVIGMIANPEKENHANGDIPVLGRFPDLPKILSREVVDEVLFVLTAHEVEDHPELLMTCEDFGKPYRLSLEHFPSITSRISAEQVEGLSLLTFTRPSSDEMKLFLKRGFDMIAAILLTVLFLPFLLMIPLLIKATSRGPVLYKQQRVGKNGRIFTMLKFRSMINGAEVLRPALESLNEADEPFFKIKHDPRVTPLGRFLRKFSLDEMPQLFNVLKGDMSVIGPRPILPNEMALMKPAHLRRLSMKPGITGLWQVDGRRDQKTFAERIQMDLAYVDGWTLWLDLKILIKTIPIAMFGIGGS